MAQEERGWLRFMMMNGKKGQVFMRRTKMISNTAAPNMFLDIN